MRRQINKLLAMMALVAALALGTANAVAGPEDGRRKDQAQHGADRAEMQKEAQQKPEKEQKAEKEARTQQAMGDKDIAGHRMLTAEERKRFTEQMQAAENDGERERIREEHRELIEARTEAQKKMPETDSDQPLALFTTGSRGPAP